MSEVISAIDVERTVLRHDIAHGASGAPGVSGQETGASDQVDGSVERVGGGEALSRALGEG